MEVEYNHYNNLFDKKITIWYYILKFAMIRVFDDAKYYEMQLTIAKLTTALKNSQQEVRCLLESLRRIKRGKF